eukprot:1182236-Prorocentrum_minimum.AAC.2
MVDLFSRAKISLRTNGEGVRRFPPAPAFLPNRRAFRSCAVVGSSPSLLKLDPPAGEEIDSHDIVMRFNNAPVKAALARHNPPSPSDNVPNNS